MTGEKSEAVAQGARWERFLRVAAIAVVIGFGAYITWINLQNSDVTLGSKRTIDEYAFTFVLARMYEGFLSHNLRDMFNITFFSYGYPYFFLQMLLTAPAQALQDYSAVLVIERSFSLIWSVLTMALVGWWIARRAGSWAYGLAAILLLAAMPGFVRMTTIVHPDTMMNFFVVAGFVAASCLDPLRRRNILVVGLLCGLGAGAKIQIVIYVPFIALLVGLRFIARQGAITTRSSLQGLAVTSAVALMTPLVYLICNPFLVKGEGLQAFLDDFNSNMVSNATNHFTYVLPAAADKLAMFSQAFFPAVAIAVLSLILLLGILWRRFHLLRLMPELLMLVCGLVTLLYIFLTVQKTWDSYYVTTFTILVISLAAIAGHLIGSLRGARQAGLALVAMAALLMVWRLPPAAASAIVDESVEVRQSQAILAVMAGVEERMSSRRHIVSGNTAFQFQKLGLRFTQVAFIYTALDERQMSDADVIVIRKNDIYFDPLWLERDDPRGVSTRHGLDLINAMRSGTQPEFALCGESAVILTFCRRSVYKVPLP